MINPSRSLTTLTISTTYDSTFSSRYLEAADRKRLWKDKPFEVYLRAIKGRKRCKSARASFWTSLNIQMKGSIASVDKYSIRILLWSSHTYHILSELLQSTCDVSFVRVLKILLTFCYENDLLPSTCELLAVEFRLEFEPSKQLLRVSPELAWSKRIYTLFVHQRILELQSTFFSVLGGAYSGLGRYNKQHADRARGLALRQIRTAQRLKDPILETKCWIYYAEGLIQLGKLKKAQKIITLQKENCLRNLMLLQEDVVLKMCENAQMKLNVAIEATISRSDVSEI
ncbi:4342_t:CDS:2 [Paraglomus brasilianum]|uniref:4342_t:CDS:1 n=1 Tax=Paraglomus brasilianum TaxID=144538 RepID=A0A9N9ANH4_9GLOM|nr:4342_t:CDS:2 [Paraglomus brasilianum]